MPAPQISAENLGGVWANKDDVRQEVYNLWEQACRPTADPHQLLHQYLVNKGIVWGGYNDDPAMVRHYALDALNRGGLPQAGNIIAQPGYYDRLAASQQRYGALEAARQAQGDDDGFLGLGDIGTLAALAAAIYTGGTALGAFGAAGAAGVGAAETGLGSWFGSDLAGLGLESVFGGATGAGAGMELGLSLPFEWGASGGMGALGSAGTAGGGMDLFTGAGSNLSGFNFGSLEEIIANAAAGNSPAGYSEFLTNPLAEFGADLGSITAAPGFWESVSKYGANAVSAVKNLLGSDGSMNDLASLLGKIAPAALGVIASNQQSKDYLQLADKYMGFGAPSRARYESSFVPGFSMANEPGYADALDQTTKSFLHKASIAGNPADSPNAWMQTLKDVNSTFAYPALQEFRRVNAGAGGLANMAPAAINAEGRSVGAERGIYDALGAGFADVFSPPKSLSDILREIRAL